RRAFRARVLRAPELDRLLETTDVLLRLRDARLLELRHGNHRDAARDEPDDRENDQNLDERDATRVAPPLAVAIRLVWTTLRQSRRRAVNQHLCPLRQLHQLHHHVLRHSPKSLLDAIE